jgi:hypothetical protein
LRLLKAVVVLVVGGITTGADGGGTTSDVPGTQFTGRTSVQDV